MVRINNQNTGSDSVSLNSIQILHLGMCHPVTEDVIQSVEEVEGPFERGVDISQILSLV